MLQLVACLALLVQSTNRTTEAAAGFDERLKRATGPAQLKQLERWCAKNKLIEERKKVLDVLSKATPPGKAAGDASQRESARTAGDQARQAVSDFRDTRAKAVGDEVGKVIAWMKTEKYA